MKKTTIGIVLIAWQLTGSASTVRIVQTNSAGDNISLIDPVTNKVVAEIKAAGGQAMPDYNSVADPASAASIVKTAVDSFGTVDIVVNNAGVLRDKTFHNMTVEDFDFVVKVHFLGTAYVTHAAWPIMRAKAYGRVVVTSSNANNSPQTITVSRARPAPYRPPAPRHRSSPRGPRTEPHPAIERRWPRRRQHPLPAKA